MKKRMKKNLFSVLGFLALICTVFFIFLPLEKASASESIQGEVEGIVEGYNLENVEFVDDSSLENALEFETVEEFEAFLQAQEKSEINPDFSELEPLPVRTPTNLPTMDAGGTKTYTFKEYTGVSVITSYAKVTRSSRGIVTKVVVWSSQSGVAFPISYSQNATDYTLYSSKKNGKAYVYGTKSYGVTIGGQGVAYKKNVTYKVSF